MRTLPTPIADALAARPRVFAGNTAVSGRVTVQPDWDLHTEGGALGLWPNSKKPVRWFQDAANDQTEVEIPNVLQINRDKSVDNLAPTCDITIANQKMNPNTGTGHVPTELGQPGYYTYNRGASAESQARWGQSTNEWHNLLVQNALIRVYQGFGGQHLSIDEAVSEGHLMLRFVGLVDNLDLASDGTLILHCRGMTGALLVDQQLYLPLIPTGLYPLDYARWVYKDFALKAAAKDVETVSQSTITSPAGDRPCRYANSSSDLWSVTYGGAGAGSNWPLHGHYPSDSLDPDHNTFWLSNGNSYPWKAFAYDWIEYDCGGEAINAFFMDPWAGNYSMFVSIMENGVWQGTQTIPYDPSELYATQTTVDTGANIPYVWGYGVPWETQQEYPLPRMYAAQRIRLTFHDEALSQWGPWYYRAGVRGFAPRLSTGQTTTVTSITHQHLDPIFYAAATHPVSGYVTVDQLYQIDQFGEARDQHRVPGSPGPSNNDAFAIRMTPSGNGYYVLGSDGGVYCYGDAVYRGDALPLQQDNLAMDIAITPTNGGYTIVRQKGDVHAFGDAPNYTSQVTLPGDGNFAISIEVPPSGGLMVLTTNGDVHAYGAAIDHGSTPYFPFGGALHVETAVDLRCTHSGNGYWILTNKGRVFAFGDAPNIGGITNPPALDGDWRHSYWQIIPVPTSDLGFLLLKGDGSIFPIGNVYGDYYGGPSQGHEQQRADGSYLDLADIARDLLLWSGFWLKETVAASAEPEVFGIIETTGTWVNDPFTSDQFDKKSVADGLTIIKDIVGYVMYELDDGGIFWGQSNFWQSGNFDENAVHSDVIPEIDERSDISALKVQLSGRSLRSPIIIASELPDPKTAGATLKVEYVPPYAGMLRHMCRPALWVNGNFTEISQMKIMAELIGLQIFFQLRQDSVEAWIDPRIEPNDQVRIFERQTSETSIHYVRGINDSMDLRPGAGSWSMSLTTNWLGTADKWVITRDAVETPELGELPNQVQVSPDLSAWIQARQSHRSVVGNIGLVPTPANPTVASTRTPTTGVGAGPG